MLFSMSYTQAHRQGGGRAVDPPPTPALKGHFSTDCSSNNILNIVHLLNINKLCRLTM